jgi:hypothetical protein
MIFGFNHAAGESDVDQVSERLCWPFRIGKSIRVSGAIDLISLDAFFLSGSNQRPQSLSLFARLQIAPVPRVVAVPGRYVTEEKNVVRFGPQGEAEAKNARGRQETHRQFFVDHV